MRHLLNSVLAGPIANSVKGLQILKEKGMTYKFLLANDHLLRALMPTMTADLNNWSLEICWPARGFAYLQIV